MTKPEPPTNRGFQAFDPQKRFASSGRSSGGNFADDPERATDRSPAGKNAPRAAASVLSDVPAGPLKEPEDNPAYGKAEERRRRPKLPT